MLVEGVAALLQLLRTPGQVLPALFRGREVKTRLARVRWCSGGGPVDAGGGPAIGTNLAGALLIPLPY